MHAVSTPIWFGRVPVKKQHLSRKYRRVALADNNKRMGETHPRAKLSDHDVELIRQLREEGLSCRAIAAKFEVARSTVSDIVNYRHRASSFARSHVVFE